MDVILAEDHPVYRENIRQIVERDTDFQVGFETANGADALEQARVIKPALAVLDINLPGIGGLEIACARLNECLDFEIIFLTMYREQNIFE